MRRKAAGAAGGSEEGILTAGEAPEEHSEFLFHHSPQGGPADSELSGGKGLVSAILSQTSFYNRMDHLIQRHILREGRAGFLRQTMVQAPLPGQKFRDIAGGDIQACGHDSRKTKIRITFGPLGTGQHGVERRMGRWGQGETTEEVALNHPRLAPILS